jgi:hypothetical protein
MVKLLKLLLIFIIIVFFFYIFGFVCYNSLLYQCLALLAVLIINSLKDSITATWRLLLLLLPFTVTLFIFGLLFQIIRLQGREDWLFDSLIKVVFFPSSFVFTKLTISLFTYRDILGLPIKKNQKREIIFMQTFFKKAFRIMPRLEFYARLHPGIQNSKGLKRNFLTFCAFPLSLYLYLMEEGQILRDYYQNRINILEDK